MKTKDEMKMVPSFDELVFENRNKEYGAYKMREKYNGALLWSLLVSVFFVSASVITPFIIYPGKTVVVETGKNIGPVVFEPTNIPIDVKKDEPPKENVVKVKIPVYVAPQVVDSSELKNSKELMTNEDLGKIVKNDSITDGDAIKVVDTDKGIITDDNKIEEIVNVSEKPYFGIEGDNEFRKWVSQNVVYPQGALAAFVQGRVFVQFVIEKDGSISNVKVLRSVDPELDKEAIRVIEASPKWTPGKQQGRPVRVFFTFPITFMIR
jgi:periplasmic protein TonB